MGAKVRSGSRGVNQRDVGLQPIAVAPDERARSRVSTAFAPDAPDARAIAIATV